VPGEIPARVAVSAFAASCFSLSVWNEARHKRGKRRVWCEPAPQTRHRPGVTATAVTFSDTAMPPSAPCLCRP
jgi:hypothetical protein